MHIITAIDWRILQFFFTEFPRSFTLLQLIFSVLFIVGPPYFETIAAKKIMWVCICRPITNISEEKRARQSHFIASRQGAGAGGMCDPLVSQNVTSGCWGTCSLFICCRCGPLQVLLGYSWSSSSEAGKTQ